MWSTARSTVILLSVVSLTVASTSTPSVEKRDIVETKTLEKRSLLGGVLCGIGLLSSCGYIDTTSDIKNCGTVGNVCPTSFANSVGSVSCSSGRCVSSCTTGFQFSLASSGCVNILSDVNNCGAVGQACSFSNGFATCSAGTCQLISCASGFNLVNGACTAINTQTNPSNCGKLGNVCGLTTGAASVVCSSGACKVGSCLAGYSASTDSTVCNAISTATDVKNCGAIGRACPLTYSNGVGSTCVSGVCQPTSCVAGFAYDYTAQVCRTITNDPNNCGSVGKVCLSAFGTAACVSSQCVTVSCRSPYVLMNGACALPASSRARVKKRKVETTVELCPGGESACPIVGSASFVIAQASGFSAFRVPDARNLKSLGGYECLDTKYAIESCGGCASMGEGANCLAIPNASGVGCSSGACVVFSCEAGYKVNEDGNGCIKASTLHTHSHGHSNRSRRAHQGKRSVGAHAHIAHKH